MLRVRPAVAAVMAGAEADCFPVGALNAETAKPDVRGVAWRAAAYDTWLSLQPLAIILILAMRPVLPRIA